MIWKDGTRKAGLLCLWTVCSLPLLAQTASYSANVGGVLFGQGWTSEIGTMYQRFPERAQGKVPDGVWTLSKNPAGLNVRFRTDATTIEVRYVLTSSGGAQRYSNMPATSQSGVDLYVRTKDGGYYWVSSQKRFSFGTTTTYTYSHLNPRGVSDEDMCEYVLYFPLYNGVRSMQVVVSETNRFEYLKVPDDDAPIVVYGSSIVQGASASRPGMAWPAIVGRETDSNVINLGFSGSAMMERSLFDMMSELTRAKLFILDPVPNIKISPGSIVSRTLEGVRQLRSATDAAILLVETLGSANRAMQPYEENRDRIANARLKEAYRAIQAEGIANVYYLTEDEIGLTEDGMIEGTHPNDIGMRQYADAYVAKIRHILGK